jgi:hypothetical protein
MPATQADAGDTHCDECRVDAASGVVCDPLVVTLVFGGSLIGRERELQLLGDLLGAVAGGPAVVVLIEGEAGIGKTRLLASMSDLAVERGMTVLRGAAHPLERTRPFAPIG